MVEDKRWKENFNNTNFSDEDLKDIHIGDIIYLNGKHDNLP